MRKRIISFILLFSIFLGIVPIKIIASNDKIPILNTYQLG